MEVVEEQERIFTGIYNECDNTNVNNVQVSVLLSYIAPYIDSTSHHFEELKKILDPNGLNPFIDKQTFLNAMLGWSKKFKNEVDFNFNNEETLSRQSSPTVMSLKVDQNYDALNLSSISGYSLTGSTLSAMDLTSLQDQNNELQHQNKKLNDCLDDVKYQLQILEEQNVGLQNQIISLEKTSISDQKLIKTLQTKCAEYEKEREDNAKILYENKSNHESLISTKSELEAQIKELERQNHSHLETIEKLTDNLNETHEINQQLMKQIQNKDIEIQEKEMEWKTKCKENEINIERYITENNELKIHIQSLEALIENDSGQKSLKMDNFEPELKDNQTNDDEEKRGKTVTISKNRSLSPEEDYCVPLERRSSPHESLLSELASVSTDGCFHSCEFRINQLEEELNKLYEELNDKTEILQEVQNANKQLEMQLTTANQDTKAFNDKFNVLTSECQQLKSNLEELTRDKQQTQIERKQMHSKLTYYKVINKNFKISLDTKKNENTALRNKLKIKDEQLEQIEQKVQKLINDIVSKENEYKSKNEEMNRIQTELRTFEEEIRELKEINCRLMNEISSLERAVKLERKRNTRVDLNCKINELEEQLEMVKSKNHQLSSSLSSVTLEKKQLICKLELLENNEYSKRKVEALETKLHKYRKMVSDLENQVLIKNKDYAELTDAHKKLGEQFKGLREYVATVKMTINTNIDLLKSTIFYTSDIWKDILKHVFPDLNLFNLLNIVNNCNDLNGSEDLLHNEMNLLNNEVNVTTILLKAFAIMKNKMKMMNEVDCSANTNLNENQIENETQDDNENKSILNFRKLCSPHESNNKKESTSTSFLSRLTPKRFSLKPPILQVKPKNQVQFVFPPMIYDTKNNQHELNNNNNNTSKKNKKKELIMDDLDSSNKDQPQQLDDTFTKTASDSLIERILAEEKIADPIEQIPSNDEKITNKQNKFEEKEENTIKERLARQVRSLSEGAPLINQLSKDGDLLVFPHLQDATLNQLGLTPKTTLSNENSEDDEEQVITNNNGIIGKFQRTSNRRRNRREVSDVGVRFQYRCANNKRTSRNTAKTTRSSRTKFKRRNKKISTSHRSITIASGDHLNTLWGIKRNSGIDQRIVGTSAIDCAGDATHLNMRPNTGQLPAGVAHLRVCEFDASASQECYQAERCGQEAIANYKENVTRNNNSPDSKETECDDDASSNNKYSADVDNNNRGNWGHEECDIAAETRLNRGDHATTSKSTPTTAPTPPATIKTRKTCFQCRRTLRARLQQILGLQKNSR